MGSVDSEKDGVKRDLGSGFHLAFFVPSTPSLLACKDIVSRLSDEQLLLTSSFDLLASNVYYSAT